MDVRSYSPVQSDVEEMCATVLEFVEGALACGVVDLETHMSTALRCREPRFTALYLDAAVAVIDLFPRSRRRLGPGVSTRELFMVCDDLLRFMTQIPGTHAVAILVTRESTSQGLGWAALRAAVEDLAR